MDTYRALVVRYERTAAHYLGYCVLADILMCLRRLIDCLTPNFRDTTVG